ncbi:holo-ACP synthase [Aliidiomarina taiwanensis]|uniref:Holo-[acyl-carrier-protein] synthase n=1 Tax=Aliidiomarina taiwanensis TaxID=946228 RepID=A0A432XA81_9GAMM|nr:holo-ACP synthase [Aliidiomarina taiwanensis]RUO44230.1 holo-ACP synthase [Aliidiomarina taiwanensis]
MSIRGIGTDIVQVQRIAAAVERQKNFAARILTAHEYAQFEQAKEPARLLAKRFAAKEACLKALGTGLAQGISWQHIEVQHTPLGQPILHLSGGAEQRAKELGVSQMDVSISDEMDYAIAFVVLS